MAIVTSGSTIQDDPASGDGRILSLTVAIAGGSGFIGQHLAASLVERGDDVIVLSRDPERALRHGRARARLVRWTGEDPDEAAAVLGGIDAVVNVTGVPVGRRARGSPDGDERSARAGSDRRRPSYRRCVGSRSIAGRRFSSTSRARTPTRASMRHRRRKRTPEHVACSALPIPLVLGQVSVLILGSVRAVPTRAIELGYRFRWTGLDAAMADILE